MNRAWYITLEHAKRSVKVEDTLDDETYRMAIQAASDAMPVPFFVQTRTIPVRARHPHHVLLRGMGLLSVTSLEIRRGMTWQAVSSADYILEPSESPYLMPPRPYWKISRTHGGGGWWWLDPLIEHHRLTREGHAPNVRITGTWGTYDVRRLLPVTLATADASTTTLTVSEARSVETGHTLHVGDEDIFVESVDEGAGTTLKVDRGVNGTTAASHGAASPIEVYTYPSVDQATLLLVQRYARRTKDAPFGVIGGIDGFMRLAINDPDVLALVGKFMPEAVA